MDYQFYNFLQGMMIQAQKVGQFESKKMQQNSFCRFQSLQSEQYTIAEPQVPRPNNIAQLLNESASSKNIKNQSEDEIIDLQSLWNEIQDEGVRPNSNKVKVLIADIENQQPCVFTEEEFDQLLQCVPQQTAEKQQGKSEKESVDDLAELWNQMEEGIQSKPSLNQHQTPQTEEQSDQQTNMQQQSQLPTLQKSESVNVKQLYNCKSENGMNINIDKDYLIYDYPTFLVNCFQSNIFSYFGFKESKQTPNKYIFYNLQTQQPLMQCSSQKFDFSLLRNNNKKFKIDYEIDYCLKFTSSKDNQVIAAAFHKYIQNGILYNIKPFNAFENNYEDSQALIEITDGFIGNNCYCNTNAFISQKYTNYPGQLKMIIGIKNGFLIANMGVSGVKSAPYNCRLQNSHSSFVYLLGMTDKDGDKFVVRVGAGMSPVVAFAISIARKRYIDSFGD